MIVIDDDEHNDSPKPTIFDEKEEGEEEEIQKAARLRIRTELVRILYTENVAELSK